MNRHVPAVVILGAILTLCAGQTATARSETSPLARRVGQIAESICAEPKVSADLFHPAFLAQVPVAQLDGVFRQYFAQGGAVVRTAETSPRGADYGEYLFTTAKGMTFPVKLGIEAAAPFRIHTLWFGLAAPGLGSADEAAAKLAELLGQASLAVFRLGDGPPRLVHGYQPDLPLAIGSAFKLYVLGALAGAVGQGGLAWDRVVSLEAGHKSLPSGVLQDWPDGTPLTLQTLAAEMISISDNTAADVLLFLVGRARVEAVQREMGHAKPELNVPFLATRELFLLKSAGHPDRAAEYLARDAAGRRAYLDGPLAALPAQDPGDLDQLASNAIDRLEWFASTADLCRAMDWLRARTEGESGRAAAPARAVLAINPGIQLDRAAWPYVGYKGGGETGVLNMTWLLGRRDGAWFAVSASWNDPAQAVDAAQFAALLQAVIGLLATE